MADPITTPVYARVNGVELEIGTLTVVPDIDATVSIDPTVLATARRTVTPE